MKNALTIDLEDWYQGLTSTSSRIDHWPSYESRIEPNTENLLSLLSQFGVKATFFALGYVADHLPGLLRRIADEGHEIAVHSYHHQHVNKLTQNQFREDVARSIEAIQKASGSNVQGYRAPMFSINISSIWALEELSEMGFRYDSSIFPIRNFYYGIPGASRFPYRPFKNRSFVEFPIATAQFFGITWPIGGGFYGRALPYLMIRAGIRKLNRQGHPAVIYAHPWEFDLDQNYKKVTARERITHYYGRAGLQAKFIRMLNDFKFGTLGDLLKGV
jgi:polysaccharide deacetylase family protein (PEP-CTERM system associated)